MFRMYLLPLIYLTLFSLFCPSCSDPVDLYQDDSSSVNSSKYYYGESSKIVYNCITSTVDTNGTKWNYHVPAIMNLMNPVAIKVSKSEKRTSNQSSRPQRMPTIFLDKVNTDEFSNQNLTVKLTNRTDGRKSIIVSHQSIGNRTTLADSGWCKSSQMQMEPTEHFDHRRFNLINGTWKVDPAFSGNNKQHTIKLSVFPPLGMNEIPPTGDHTLGGQITYRSTCSAIADLGAEKFIAEGKNRVNARLRSKRGALLAAYDIIGFFAVAYSVHRCQQDPDLLQEARRHVTWTTNPLRIIPTWFREACVQRQGSQPMYGTIPSGEKWIGSYICVNYFGENNQGPPAIEVLLSSSTHSNDSSEWIRFFKE